MVSDKKKQAVKEVIDYTKQYSLTGVINMHKMPARQLLDIRNKLRGEAMIRMVKKRLITIALRESGVKGMEDLSKYVQGEPALLFSNSDPFRLARIIEQSKSDAFAKEGDIAPNDIIVRAGPTNLSAGPVIGELQRVKIPVMVQGEKLAIREDAVVAKKGDAISKNLADVLSKLGIEPISIGLNLVAVCNDGLLYEKDILFTPLESYFDNIKRAYSSALNLSINIGYPTKESMPILLSKAHNEAVSLALKAGVVTKETTRPLVARAHAHAKVLKEKIGHIKPEEGKSGETAETG